MITIMMDADDFDRLTSTSAAWAASIDLWAKTPGRFEPYSGGKDPVKDEPGRHWQWLHYIGPDYAALLLARAFLASSAHPFEVVYDTASVERHGDSMGWAILTDYSPTGEPG